MAIEKNDKTFLKGAYAPQLEWRNFADVLGWSALEEAIDRVHKNESIMGQTPYKGAVQTVNRLAEYHEIKYVTTRKDKTAEVTEEWLDNCGFPPGLLYCSGQDKKQHIADCQYLIDDRPKTILNFIYDINWKLKHFNWKMADYEPSSQRLAFGLWFPYNQALTDVKNVLLAPTWRGIEYYLERKGVL